MPRKLSDVTGDEQLDFYIPPDTQVSARLSNCLRALPSNCLRLPSIAFGAISTP